MAPARLHVNWSDEVNDLAAASTNGATTKVEAAYAIKWGEKVEVSALPFFWSLRRLLNVHSTDY